MELRQKSSRSRLRHKPLYSGSTLYVARIRVDPETGKYIWKNSRPCNICIHFMLMYGIKKVVYTVESGKPTNQPHYRSIRVEELAQEPMFISQGSKYLYNLGYKPT